MGWLLVGILPAQTGEPAASPAGPPGTEPADCLEYLRHVHDPSLLSRRASCLPERQACNARVTGPEEIFSEGTLNVVIIELT